MTYLFKGQRAPQEKRSLLEADPTSKSSWFSYYIYHFVHEIYKAKTLDSYVKYWIATKTLSDLVDMATNAN